MAYKRNKFKVVISVSKIEISKAIHNLFASSQTSLVVVISVSKIEISKAIHNLARSYLLVE